jgi:hypothetical protein
MSRHPHDIPPRDDKDELLVAIYDVLVEIRAALTPVALEPLVSAGVVPEPEPEPAPAPKPAAKKAPAKKPAPRKKRA